MEKIARSDPDGKKRGWYMGTAVFRDQLLSMLEESSSDNCRGEQRRMHGEYMAKELLKKGLGLLKCTLAGARDMPHNHHKKQALVWLLKRNTVVTGEWIREELRMGSRANITRALQRFDHSTEKEIKRIKRKMTQCAG